MGVSRGSPCSRVYGVLILMSSEGFREDAHMEDEYTDSPFSAFECERCGIACTYVDDRGFCSCCQAEADEEEERENEMGDA